VCTHSCYVSRILFGCAFFCWQKIAMLWASVNHVYKHIVFLNYSRYVGSINYTHVEGVNGVVGALRHLIV
jgi:hypothetical protein